MSEETAEQAAPKKFSPGKMIGRLVKLTLFLGMFMFAALTILANIGGNSPILHQAIEDVLSQKSGYSASILTFNRMSFFPNIVIDVENVEFRNTTTSTREIEGEPAQVIVEAYGNPVMSIDKAYVAMGFFDLMSGSNKIKALTVENFKAMPGTMLGKGINIKTVSLGDIPLLEGHADANNNAALSIAATIDGHPLTANIGFEGTGKPRHRKYSVGKQRNVSIKMGETIVNAVIHDNEMTNGLSIQNMQVTHAGKDVVTGNLDLAHNAGINMEISGELELHPKMRKITPDVEISFADNAMNLQGKINAETLNLDDLATGAPLTQIINNIGKIFAASKSEDIGLHDKDVSIDLNIAALYSGDIEIGHVKTPITIKDSILKIGPLSGQVSGGNLDGVITLDASKNPAELVKDITVKGMDYGALQRQFIKDAPIEGRGDIALSITSKAQTFDALKTNAVGDFTFISGAGEMQTDILNLWSGGLLNAMLPNIGKDKQLTLNCAVVDLDIKDQMLKTNALFMDTNDITLNGEGVYRLAQDKLDLKLVPKTKDVALLDVATAVNLKGPIKDISVTPSALDIGKKVGGLLLGTVSPAFSAVTLVDLGLADNHPCKKYIIEKEELAPPAPSKSAEITIQESVQQ